MAEAIAGKGEAEAASRGSSVRRSEVQRLCDAYLAALGIEPATRRRLMVDLLRRARALKGVPLLDAVWHELTSFGGLGDASAEHASGELALPPERPAPMPDHDLAAAWMRRRKPVDGSADRMVGSEP